MKLSEAKKRVRRKYPDAECRNYIGGTGARCFEIVTIREHEYKYRKHLGWGYTISSAWILAAERIVKGGDVK